MQRADAFWVKARCGRGGEGAGVARDRHHHTSTTPDLAVLNSTLTEAVSATSAAQGACLYSIAAGRAKLMGCRGVGAELRGERVDADEWMAAVRGTLGAAAGPPCAHRAAPAARAACAQWDRL